MKKNINVLFSSSESSNNRRDVFDMVYQLDYTITACMTTSFAANCPVYNLRLACDTDCVLHQSSTSQQAVPGTLTPSAVQPVPPSTTVRGEELLQRNQNASIKIKYRYTTHNTPPSRRRSIADRMKYNTNTVPANILKQLKLKHVKNKTKRKTEK